MCRIPKGAKNPLTELSMLRTANAWLVFACLLLLPSLATAANQVSLTPSTQKVTQGLSAELALEIAFADSTIGGGIVIEPDPSLSFVSFDFDPGFPDDPGFRLVCPNPADSRCDDFAGPGVLVAFGSVAGLSGSHVVGALRLLTTVPGIQPVGLREDDAQGVAGPFQPVGGGSFESPSFVGASIDVAPPLAVPSASIAQLLALAGLLAAAGRGALARA
jgi:hypothetical protein